MAALFLASFLVLTASAAERQVVKGHVPAAAATAAPVDRLPQDRQLHLAINLPLRNQKALTNFLEQLYDPASPNYHHYLTPQQFTAAYGPTESDYHAVVAYAKSCGFSVVATHPNRQLLEVTASVADIEKNFRVHMRVYPHPTEKRQFYSPDAEPSLDLSVPVLSIAGLNNFQVPRPAGLHTAAAAHRHSLTPNTGSEIDYDDTYVGLDFRAAYVPGTSLDGAGQSVGLVEFDTYHAVDITDYLNDQYSGLIGSSVALSNVVSGTLGSPGDGQTEVDLDIDMAISMAPGLSTVYVYEAPNDISYADVILNNMTSNTLCRQFSSSWSGFYDAGAAQDFLVFATQGQSFFLASGDSGAYFPSGNPVVPPCDDPNITIVGGTTLNTTGPKGNYISETVWSWYSNPWSQFSLTNSAGSGGISPTFPIPSWQQGLASTTNLGSTNYRNFPDVSMVADHIFLYSEGGLGFVAGGTSAAAPLWAGFIALVNQQEAELGQQPVGFLNPALYALGKSSNYASCFNDITVGNNTNFNGGGDTNANNPSYTENFVNTNLFPAVPGFDLCTGWGTPNGSNLINALAPQQLLVITPLNGFSATGTAGFPFSPTSQTYTLTNTGIATINWSVVNNASWLTASTPGGALPPGQSTTLAISLNGPAASSLAVADYTTNVSIIDSTDGVTQTRYFDLTILSPQVLQNGGFELGTFADWSLSGPSGTSSDNLVVNSGSRQFVNSRGKRVSASIIAQYIHSGTYAALLGEPGALSYLSQTLETSSGQNYLVSFWLANSGQLSGGDVTPNEFQMNWNGVTLYDQVDMAAFTWTNMQFIVTATNTPSVLEFGARNDNDWFGFDDVSVLSIPKPGFTQAAWTNGSVSLGWTAVSGLVYQLQYTTNFPGTNWINLGGGITATNGAVIATDMLPSDPHRFYRLLLLP